MDSLIFFYCNLFFIGYHFCPAFDKNGPLSVFRCKSGHCINDTDVCNTILDCPDGSDEDIKYCCKIFI